ncbi:unnamed protein product, partial [Hymenolepis diminuta]
DDLWWAAFHLVPCLHFGQEDLFIELLQKIVFPIYDLTPIETSAFSETISNSTVPWPPVHESFSRGLAFHAHKLYGEYFADLFQRRSASASDFTLCILSYTINEDVKTFGLDKEKISSNLCTWPFTLSDEDL